MKQSLKGAQPKGYSPTGPGEVRSIFITLSDVEGFSDGSVGKESACSTGDTEMQVQSLIPWSRKGQPTLVFLPEKSHGQRSLVGYSPKRCKEGDTTEYKHLPTCFSMTLLNNDKGEEP